MATVILVSLMTPIVVGVLLLAARRGLPQLAADVRGIALQTVIVIVVMLAIAGAVAGVLLSTGAEVTSNLEESDLATGLVQSEAECNGYEMPIIDGGSDFGEESSDKCRWDAGSGKKFSARQCTLQNGALTMSDQICTTAHDIV